MNRTEKRRQQKKTENPAKNAKPKQLTSPSSGQQTLSIQQAIDLAVQHHNAGRLAQAESIYQQILKADPNHPDALQLLGEIAYQAGKYDIAVDLITRALAINSNSPASHNNLGNALMKLGKLEEAVASYHKALAIKPDFAGAHNNLGTALRELGKLEEAVASYHKAFAIKPDFAEAHYDLGLVLSELGKLEKAVDSYHKALAIKPDFAEAHHNLGGLQLLIGDLQNGWKNYAWRWRVKGFPYSQRKFKEPFLDGEELEGRTKFNGSSPSGRKFLVWMEQGIGDAIMYASMIPDLIELGADINLECDKRLIPLFSRSFPTITCANMDDPDIGNAEDMKFDLQLPLGNFGRWLRADMASFPARPPYFVADSQQRQTLRKRYLERGNDVLVGIAWYSNSRTFGVRKSMTLHDLRPLLEVPGITFIDLQYGDTGEERKAFTAETGIDVFHDDGVDQMADLDIFASQVAAMDMVVTISNTTAHMAGALGVPTLLMLGSFPIWYWMLEREDSPWYPSLRLFRQHERGDWQGVVERVCKELSTRVGGC